MEIPGEEIERKSLDITNWLAGDIGPAFSQAFANMTHDKSLLFF